ncbi:MAG: alpha/beta fold hydrolase [Thermosynechococcaceae cyanobacterium]
MTESVTVTATFRPSSLSEPLPQRVWQWRGFDVAYTVMGEGNPLLLIHGFGATYAHWRKNIPVLAEAGYRVYALDLLGFGASDKPALDYSLNLWQELVRDFWRDQIRQPMVVVGNSIGALLCLMLLAQYPDMAIGGIVLNVAGGLNHRPEELNLPLRLLMGLLARLAGGPLIGPMLFNQIRQKQRIRKTLGQVYVNPDAITDELVDLIYAPTCDRKAQKVFASIITAPPGPRIAELLPQIRQPLLVLWGAADPWTPIQGAQVFQEWSTMAETGDQPQFQIIPIPDTGHCPHDERPELVNPLMLDWLSDFKKF